MAPGGLPIVPYSEPATGLFTTGLLVFRGEFTQDPQRDADASEAPAAVRGRGDPNLPATTQEEGAGGQGGAPPANIGDACIQNLPIFLAFIAIFYFLIIRPGQKQEKKRRALLAAAKKGDRVATQSGLHGEITNLTDSTVTLRVAKDVKLTFDRSAIGRVLNGDQTAGTAGPRGAADPSQKT